MHISIVCRYAFMYVCLYAKVARHIVRHFWGRLLLQTVKEIMTKCQLTLNNGCLEMIVDKPRKPQ